MSNKIYEFEGKKLIAKRESGGYCSKCYFWQNGLLRTCCALMVEGRLPNCMKKYGEFQGLIFVEKK